MGDKSIIFPGYHFFGLNRETTCCGVSWGTGGIGILVNFKTSERFVIEKCYDL